jgi:phytol kinase
MFLMAVTVTLVIVLVLLLLNEWLWRRTKRHSEFSRKFVHITVGSFVAFWPYFLSWDTIRLLSVAFLVVVALSKYFGIFKAIHSVTRPTWGEMYFALAVGLVTLVTNRPAVYTIALLQMSLADGLAAIVGTRYGKGNEYKVFGIQKSLAGSGTFLIVSYVVLLGLAVFSTPVSIFACLGIALVATIAENTAGVGLDNLVVPILVAAMLRLVVH